MPCCLLFLQGWWPLGQSYCDTVIDGWLSAALQEWRHGSSINPQAAAAGQGLDPVPEPVTAAPMRSTAASNAGAAVLRTLQQQRRGQRVQLPSWVQRATSAGLLDPQQQFDPTKLANILCSCNPELKPAEPVDQAHAVDAVLNTAAAPAVQVASAAEKAAKAAAAARKGSSDGSGTAKYSWLFGFGRTAAHTGPTTAGSALPGLRGEGAWEPFGADISAEHDMQDSGSGAIGLVSDNNVKGSSGKGDSSKGVAVQQQPGGRWGWWGARRGSHAASGQHEQAQGTAQLRSKL